MKRCWFTNWKGMNYWWLDPFFFIHENVLGTNLRQHWKGMNLPRTSWWWRKKFLAGTFFSAKRGWNCVLLGKGPKFGTGGNFAGSNYSLHIAWRQGLCSTHCEFSRGTWKETNHPYLTMDDLLKSKLKSSKHYYAFILHLKVELCSLGCAPRFFRLLYWRQLWLPRSVAQQVVHHRWNMLESLKNHTICVSTTWIFWICIKYCVHVHLPQLSPWLPWRGYDMTRLDLKYVARWPGDQGWPRWRGRIGDVTYGTASCVCGNTWSSFLRWLWRFQNCGLQKGQMHFKRSVPIQFSSGISHYQDHTNAAEARKN